MNADLPERFRGSRPSGSQQSDQHLAFNSGLDISLNMDVRRYVHAQEKIPESAEPGEWLSFGEVPGYNEIALAPDVEVSLMPNKQSGKWKKIEKYLKAHYALLREDAVTPLRDAVDKFRKNPGMSDDFTTSVYEKVHIIGFTFSQLGMAARIQFSTARSGRRILWQASKRLVSGTLVALSPVDDHFETKTVIALVAARSLQGVQCNPPEIDIFFSRPEDTQVDPQQEWTMVEAKTGYYEAYRHTLRAVQKLSQEGFPLSQHICSLSQDIEPPAYLTANPMMDLTPATAEGQDSFYGEHDVINQWPSAAQSGLDETQWEALNQILTKSLAIVQGPPGTGKTHVSKVALEILCGYMKEEDPPIIIAAQTNHALDQLLSHVAVFEPRYVRLGGRSTNVEVKKRALYEIRKMERLPPIPKGLFGKASNNWTQQANELIKTLEPLHKTPSEPHSTETLYQNGIMSEKQYQSLGTGAARWISSDGSESDPLKLWLGERGLQPFKVDYVQDTYGFDMEDADEDLEFEQVREHEAEHGVNDEEDADLLKGSWCCVQESWTGCGSHVETDLEKAADLLNSEEDIWKVPMALRGPIYAVMQTRLKAVLLKKVRELAISYDKNLKDLKIGKWERDAIFLQRAKIVGMTTTGLSKYRPLLASLKPKVILIEEAAEVIEAPVTVACMESVEHLILVGDHQQLQGHCSVHELENEPYYLNVSLFERLVNNKIPFKTLLRQRRMDPAFRKLISGIYPNLQDHASVIDRQSHDWGMSNVKSFFLSHDWSEYKDSTMSTYNEEEAVFVAGFYRYLVQNGVPPSAVTILTFYNGQRKRLLKEIRKHKELAAIYNDVKTVDSYQGEENFIVLLSLTRSNTEGKIGFLEIDNRVCVALSRAKFGFYIFGNSHLLAERSLLWNTVVRIMLGTKRLSTQFPLYCQRHKHTTVIRYPDDWTGIDGGCHMPCRQKLECGHGCQLKCHPFPHEKIECRERCERKLECPHPCQKLCHEPCACNCDAFQAAERQKWDPHPRFGSIDVRNDAGEGGYRMDRAQRPAESDPWATGKYLAGQKPYSRIGNDLYLPEQSRNDLRTQTSGTRREPPPGMPPHLPLGMPMATTRQPQRFGKQYRSSYSTNSFLPGPMMSRISPEQQAHSRNTWSSFAKGGVKQDDERRETSTS